MAITFCYSHPHHARRGVDVLAKTSDGWQALHCATKWDKPDAVDILLQNGADINAKTNGKVTPLHLACQHGGRLTLSVLLVHEDLDVTATNEAGETAADSKYRYQTS